MTDEDKLQPLSGPGVSGNEPLAGREEKQVEINSGFGGTVISSEDFTGEGTPVHVLCVKLHELGVEQVRDIVRSEVRSELLDLIQAIRGSMMTNSMVGDEIRKALKETFQR